MIAEKTYIKAKTIEEATALAHQHKNSFRYIAGGTDVLVNKFQANEDAACLIDISGIDELKTVSKDSEYLRIGALLKLDNLQKHPEIRDEFPALIEAAKSVASPMIRKAATIGGNLLCENRCSFYNQSEFWREAAGYCLKCEGDICIATGGKKACFSKFVSDTAPALISMDAKIEVVEKGETKIIPLEDIYTGDGISPRNLDTTVILKSILLPLNRGYRSAFRKLRQRESLEFTSLTTAVSIDKNGKIKIAMAGIDPKPIVVEGTKEDDQKELIKQAIKKSRIVDNDSYSRTYRKEMIGVFLERSFEEVILNRE